MIMLPRNMVVLLPKYAVVALIYGGVALPKCAVAPKYGVSTPYVR